MKIPGSGKKNEKIELQMTPMIDVTFQLLTFFLFTMKFVDPEGDFSVKMPLASVRAAQPSERQQVPLRLYLRANEKGDLTGIRLNEAELTQMEQLRGHVLGIIGDPRGPDGGSDSDEIELLCDERLKYKHTIDAVTHVSGFIDPKTGRTVKLIEKIKFGPPLKGE